MLNIGAFKQRLPTAETALKGRETPLQLDNSHKIHGHKLNDAFIGYKKVVLGLGCFWGAERKFWNLEGVFTTAVGYCGGYTPNPTYEEVCSGLTGHTEVVLIVYQPEIISLKQLLQVFWEVHNPTQGMQQGNDIGSQYRSAIYCYSDDDYNLAQISKLSYQEKLIAAGYPQITTEIQYPAPCFYYAENYHQQYLAKNPKGYCGLKGTGVICII